MKEGARHAALLMILLIFTVEEYLKNVDDFMRQINFYILNAIGDSNELVQFYLLNGSFLTQGVDFISSISQDQSLNDSAGSIINFPSI